MKTKEPKLPTPKDVDNCYETLQKLISHTMYHVEKEKKDRLMSALILDDALALSKACEIVNHYL